MQKVKSMYRQKAKNKIYSMYKMNVRFPNRSVSIAPISLSAGIVVIHSDFTLVEFRWISFFYHNSSQILLLRLHIVVLRPADMGVFHHWSFFQTLLEWLWSVGSKCLWCLGTVDRRLGNVAQFPLPFVCNGCTVFLLWGDRFAYGDLSQLPDCVRWVCT